MSIHPLIQVEDTRFVFEAKTLQRMELLVLSTLDWKMNPITPLSFVDHMVRRMASENRKNKPQHWKFQKMCHSTLLSAVAGRQIDFKIMIFFLMLIVFMLFLPCRFKMVGVSTIGISCCHNAACCRSDGDGGVRESNYIPSQHQPGRDMGEGTGYI